MVASNAFRVVTSFVGTGEAGLLAKSLWRIVHFHEYSCV